MMGRGDVSVIVPQHVPDPGHLGPGDIGIPGFKFGGKTAARFGDNFDAALDQPLLLPIGFESVE